VSASLAGLAIPVLIIPHLSVTHVTLQYIID